MRVMLSAYGSRGGVEPVMGLTVRLRAPATSPDCATAEGCDAVVATGVVPAGVWR